MLRTIAAIAILVFGVAVFVAVEDERATKQHAQQSTYTYDLAFPSKPNEQHLDNDAYNPERDTPRWYGMFRWRNGGIETWALILTLAAISEQTRQTAKAAEATKKSAETILRQMDLYVNAERARLAIDISSLGSSLLFRAKNIGKTNANITRMAGFTDTIHQKETLPDLPKYLTPEHKRFALNLWLGQGDSTDIEDDAKDAGNGNPILMADLSAQATRNNIQMHGWNLWVFGQICYRDGISPQDRELRFCYAIGVDKFDGTWAYPAGPAAYHKDT